MGVFEARITLRAVQPCLFLFTANFFSLLSVLDADKKNVTTTCTQTSRNEKQKQVQSFDVIIVNDTIVWSDSCFTGWFFGMRFVSCTSQPTLLLSAQVIYTGRIQTNVQLS